MAKFTIFHNPRCSKSRETLNILQDQGVDIEIVEYLKTPPSSSDLAKIIKKLGIEPRSLLRTKETEYKALGLESSTLTDDEIIDAMVNTPKLIERPIVIKDQQAVIGRPPENVKALF